MVSSECYPSSFADPSDERYASYKRFTRDYYRIVGIVYRVLKQPNAVVKITGLISNVTHRLNCSPEK